MPLVRRCLVVVAALVVTALAAPAAAEVVRPDASTAATVVAPPVNGRFDYQIGGAYRPQASVAIVDRDAADAPVAGRYNICYLNAFQSQPGASATWSSKGLLLTKGGRPVGDPDWPGEYLLDTSTAATRDGILAVVGAWIDDCAARGYQAVEPDNLDSWTRSKGLLTEAHNLAMVTSLATRAHADGLAIAQKNTSQLGTAGRDVAHLDFAVAEECQRYAECGDYTDVYGDRVIEIEYTDNARRFYTAACAARGARISVILRDRDVVPSGRPAYRYQAC